MVRQECWRREVEMDGALSGTGHHSTLLQTVLTVPVRVKLCKQSSVLGKHLDLAS